MEQPTIESQVMTLKEELADWKPVVLSVSRLVLWETPVEAAVLAAVPTLFFALVYYLDASFLTILSIVGLIIMAADIGLPYVVSHLGMAPKDEDADILFERFCDRVVTFRVNFRCCFNSLQKFRTEKPPVFYIIVGLLLVSIAWIGCCINNVFLAYLTTMVVLIYPGISKHRMLQAAMSKAMELVKMAIAKVKSTTQNIKEKAQEKKAK